MFMFLLPYQVTMLDVSSSSVLFITDCSSNSSSRITSVAVTSLGNALEDTAEQSEEGTRNACVKEVISVLNRDAEVVLLDGSTGKKIGSQAKHQKEMSTAISLHVLGKHDFFIFNQFMLALNENNYEKEKCHYVHIIFYYQ